VKSPGQVRARRLPRGDPAALAACNLKGSFAADLLQVHRAVILGTTISRRIGKPASGTIQWEKVHHTGEAGCNSITKSGALILIAVVPAGDNEVACPEDFPRSSRTRGPGATGG
jgi:hypothetical protein